MDDQCGERETGVGFDQIDGEHRVQMGLLAALRDAIADRRPRTEVSEILERLVDYTKVHFMSEELLMRLYQYPHYQRHVGEHDRMIEQVEEAREHYRSGDRTATTATLNAAITELAGHIGRSDRTLGGYLSRLQRVSD